VRIFAENGVVSEGVTPYTASVQRGMFGWTVEKEGFVSDSSRQRTLDLVARTTETVELTLTPAGARGTTVQRADSAFARGDCAQAVQLYESVARPANVRETAGDAWLNTRLRLGQCYGRLREYDKAIKAYDGVLADRPGQWSAKYEGALASCAAQDFRTGRASFRELGGAFVGNTSGVRRPAIRALARYGSGLCSFQEYERQSNTALFDDLRDTAISEFEEFLVAIGALSRESIPEDMRGAVAAAESDAKQKLATLKGR